MNPSARERSSLVMEQKENFFANPLPPKRSYRNYLLLPGCLWRWDTLLMFLQFLKTWCFSDVVATGEISVTMTIDLPLEKIPEVVLEELKMFSRIDILENQAIILPLALS